MNQLTNKPDAASYVAQNNQVRAQGLGRGPCPKNELQSPHSQKSLKILQCNINGLTTPATRIKLEQLLDIAEENNVQILAIQETKLKMKTILKYRGYNIFRKDRSTNGGGGLAFFVRGLSYQSIDTSSVGDSDLEIQGIKIFWRGKPLRIFNVYHPTNHKHLPDCFSNFMDKNTIILGDLNAKHSTWGCSNDNDRGSDLLQLADDNDFMLLNDGTPTHTSFSYNTSEALDITMTSSNLFSQCSWTVQNNIGSDHLPVIIEFRKRQKVSNSNEKFWNFRKANWACFRDSVDEELASLQLMEDVNHCWQIFKRIILKYAKAFIPRGNVKSFMPHYTQYTATLDPLFVKRKQLIESARSSGVNLRPEISKINAEIKLAYTQLKRTRWNEICSKIDIRTPDSKLWKLLKGINKEQMQYENCNTIKDDNGHMFADDKSAANGLAAHYQQISRLIFTNEDKPVMRRARNVVHGCRSTDRGDPSLATQFNMQELLLAMALLDLSKSPGPDGIHGHMIENLGSLGKQKLLDLFNISWRKGRLPQEWKKATVIPIKKPGGDSCSPGDFRPIALTCTTSKIMEKMVLIRLHFFLDKSNSLPREQFGFRRGHGTMDQVLFFAQTIRDAQNHKPTHHSVAALLDLTKAFDRVWRDKLIIKLHDTFGIRGNTLAWISDYLHQRFIRVKFNGTLSNTVHLGQGVPQGTVLSPTLFTLYLAGIEKTVSLGTRIGMFADDIALWSSGDVVAEIESRLNSSLEAISKFADELKLKFNPSKSITTFFTTNKRLYKYEPSLLLKHQKLSYEKHPKYLGFILDPEFTSNKHIEYIVSKARKRLNIIKCIAGRDWGADATTLRTSYQALVRPILEYGFPVYCCASDTNLNKLEKVQLSAARIITGMKRSCPSEIVLYEADLQPLYFRRQAGLVKYFNKLSSIDQGNLTATYLNNWTCNQRLKKNSPFSQVKSQQLIAENVEPHYLHSNLDTCVDLSSVGFHEGLPTALDKRDCVPDFLKQLALEIINQIPPNDIKIYTDGSKMDGQSGSGVFIETTRENYSIKLRNPDFCSVFRSELIAIDRGLEKIMCERNYGNIWILSDSRSSIQHLKNWALIGDKTSLSILQKVKLLSQQHEVHFQWIPSHVDIHGNELADTLAKEGLGHPVPSTSELTYLELFARQKAQNKQKWLLPPSHYWYKAKRPGLSLSLPGDRQSNTCLSRLASGHLKSLTFSANQKIFPLCPKCQQNQASPEHILNCLGLDWEDIHSSPLLVSDFINVNGFIDLV